MTAAVAEILKGRLAPFARALCVSYAEILFMQRAWAGLLMLGVTFLLPSVGITGLVSVAAAYAFARFIGMGRSFLASGFFTYNALLVGLGLGHLFAVTPLSLMLAAVAGVMTFTLSLMLDSLFRTYLRLPILSLPFVVVSAVLYLASLGYSNLLFNEGAALAPTALPGWVPAWLSGFFSALGAILFLPDPVAGLLLALVILASSRILFLLALAGYLLGVGVTALFGGSLSAAVADLNSFNFILVAMALGGVFLVPCRQSLMVVVLAVPLAAVLLGAVKLFWSMYGLPAFTLPFNMVTLSLLYGLGLVAFPKVADRIGATPEETLDDHLSRHLRFPREPRRVGLPFSGGWRVWQGFDGRWTHQGGQARALDFVMTHDGVTHRNDGGRLEDYPAWKKVVLAPVRGRVARVRDGVEDNPPGVLNEKENWGNWLSIDSGLGWHLVLAHFAKDSIRVKPGDWVEPGSLLGLCGNSGYSPQPHIHMHLQAGPVPGEVTLPFLVEGFTAGGRFVPAGVPEEEEEVAPLYPSDALSLASTLVLDSRLKLTLEAGSAPVSREAQVKMNALAETFLQTEKGRLFFHRERHQFYFYRLEGGDEILAALFRFLPRLPLGYEKGLRWSDSLPTAVRARRWQRAGLDLARVLFPRLGEVRWEGGFTGRDRIEGRIHENGESRPFEIILSDGHGLIRSAADDRQKLEVVLRPHEPGEKMS